jgi:hypothetical protein
VLQHAANSSPNVRMITLGTMRWAGRVVRMKEITNPSQLSSGNLIEDTTWQIENR